MRLNNLEVSFHRTVRVAEGRAASSLPPSLGHMKMFKVLDYRKSCPMDWDDNAYFMSLHDTEAMWISFNSNGNPCAVLIGAGGVNALTGQKLGTKLEKDNYLVCPPQPWIDGWKDVDGTVHQFIATPHKKGDGLTVAEQIIGAESKTGAMGLAIFDPKTNLHPTHTPHQGVMGQSFSTTMDWKSYDSAGIGAYHQAFCLQTSASINDCEYETQDGGSYVKCTESAGDSVLRSARAHVEMGVGKGGKIIQKIYEDPYGIEVWKETPAVVFAFYLVDAKTAEEITGEKVAAPADHAQYNGPWFGLQDEKLSDVLGTSIFSGLKSAAFIGDTSNVNAEKTKEPVSVEVEAGA